MSALSGSGCPNLPVPIFRAWAVGTNLLRKNEKNSHAAQIVSTVDNSDNSKFSKRLRLTSPTCSESQVPLE
jgi:hypothetical protein